jgi:DDE family transposase
MRACRRSQSQTKEGTVRVQALKRSARLEVTADGDGVVGHAGVVLLAELADRLGLPGELDRWAGRGQTSRHRHRMGQVLTDVAVMLADGGDCLSDLAVLRDQPGVFGPVASTPTAWRVLERLAQAGERGLAGVRVARARARARAWRSGAWVDGPLTVDLDATLITAHSDKQGAEGNYKHGYGFHPLGAWLDRGDGTGEPLAAILRPGSAGANTAADHIEVINLAVAQLPRAAREAQPILVRADSAGATHAFLAHLRERGVRFSVGFDLDQRVRDAILALPADAWQPAADADGQAREGAQVAELHALNLDLAVAGWPTGTRAICRRERPHPGAQLTFTDADGWRFQVFITDQSDPNITTLELRHRQHARVEDRIRAAKATGARNLPFDLWRRNAVWLELVLLALDLVAWTQSLLLDGDLAVAEPKTLRYRLWHVAGRISRHARRVRLRLQRTWPWAGELVAAFTRLRALPLRC